MSQTSYTFLVFFFIIILFAGYFSYTQKCHLSYIVYGSNIKYDDLRANPD